MNNCRFNTTQSLQLMQDVGIGCKDSNILQRKDWFLGFEKRFPPLENDARESQECTTDDGVRELEEGTMMVYDLKNYSRHVTPWEPFPDHVPEKGTNGLHP